MSNQVIPSNHNRVHRDQFHPLIYRVAGGLAVWFAVSAWILFDHRGYIGLALTFISILLLMALGIPLILWRQWWKYGRSKDDRRDAVSLRDWGSGDMDVWGARLHSKDAAINMLLPLAAVAFGLTAIGIVLLFVEPAVA
ncbi:MAG: hypothetical protein J0H71_02610 [Rhizobiales bacterium]|nr:hypothetical protein [Hyphomicrobiales bacterium]